MLRQYGKALSKVRFSLITIAAMMSIGFMTRYSGLDATMGFAFARPGTFYPFFGTLLAWLGVALTGSATSSQPPFSTVQEISASPAGRLPTIASATHHCARLVAH